MYPNQSCDDNLRVGDEIVFPNESLPDGEFHGPWFDDEVVAFLWREGKVPEWIDASVVSLDVKSILIHLRCCGRFTESEELLYHRPRGLAAFSIKVPALPPTWESVEESGRFDLYWQLPKPTTPPWCQFW